MKYSNILLTWQYACAIIRYSATLKMSIKKYFCDMIKIYNKIFISTHAHIHVHRLVK